MAAKSTKTSTILRLISRKIGATAEQLQKATGWQPHSVRAAISGLRKAGHTVQTQANAKGVSVYKLAKEG